MFQLIVIFCIINGDVHQFIGNCLIPLVPCNKSAYLQEREKEVGSLKCQLNEAKALNTEKSIALQQAERDLKGNECRI